MKETGKCPNCGAKILQGTKVRQYYCLNCGAALDEERKRKEATKRQRKRLELYVEESPPSTSSGKLFSGLRELVTLPSIMKIKKQDSYHLVITPSLALRVGGLLFLGVFIFGVGIAILASIAVGVGGFTLFILILFIAVLPYIAGRVIGKKLVLDKLTENIILEERHFMVIHKRRVIPFSAVTSVAIEYKGIWHVGQWGHTDAWQVSLNVSGEMIKLDHQTSQKDMHKLANEIGRFIDKEIVVKSRKPEVDWLKYSPRH